MYCSRCGRPVAQTALFCEACGARIERTPASGGASTGGGGGATIGPNQAPLPSGATAPLDPDELRKTLGLDGRTDLHLNLVDDGTNLDYAVETTDGATLFRLMLNAAESIQATVEALQPDPTTIRKVGPLWLSPAPAFPKNWTVLDRSGTVRALVWGAARPPIHGHAELSMGATSDAPTWWAGVDFGPVGGAWARLLDAHGAVALTAEGNVFHGDFVYQSPGGRPAAHLHKPFGSVMKRAELRVEPGTDPLGAVVLTLAIDLARNPIGPVRRNLR